MVGSGIGGVSPSSLYKLIIPLLRCETADMRNAVVDALGMINYAAVRYCPLSSSSRALNFSFIQNLFPLFCFVLKGI